MKKDKIELELRGFFDEETKKEVERRLKENGIIGEIDNRRTIFYMIENGSLKITKSSNWKAKIALKKGDFVKDDGLIEIESKIYVEEFEKLNHIFENLGFTDTQMTEQERTNYMVGNGIELAIKYSKDWGHHFEIDKLIDKNDDVEIHKKELIDILNKYGLHIATNEEIEALKNKVDSEHRKK